MVLFLLMSLEAKVKAQTRLVLMSTTVKAKIIFFIKIPFAYELAYSGNHTDFISSCKLKRELAACQSLALKQGEGSSFTRNLWSHFKIHA
jgi:hypothetical protein